MRNPGEVGDEALPALISSSCSLRARPNTEPGSLSHHYLLLQFLGPALYSCTGMSLPLLRPLVYIENLLEELTEVHALCIGQGGKTSGRLLIQFRGPALDKI